MSTARAIPDLVPARMLNEFAYCDRRILEVQTRLLARHLNGELAEFPEFCTRQPMRSRHIVTYDILQDKRRTRVFKVLEGYGDHMQFSVFRCDLSPKEKVLLMAALDSVINHKDDQVILVDLGPGEGRADERITALGVPYDHKPVRVVVV
jgi:CRISPR-associated protein Cas2